MSVVATATRIRERLDVVMVGTKQDAGLRKPPRNRAPGSLEDDSCPPWANRADNSRPRQSAGRRPFETTKGPSRRFVAIAHPPGEPHRGP